MSDAESSDEDYDFHTTGNDLQGEDDEARYPIHDYCEFEDVEALKVRSCIALQVAAQNVAIDHGTMVHSSVCQRNNPHPSRNMYSSVSFLFYISKELLYIPKEYNQIDGNEDCDDDEDPADNEEGEKRFKPSESAWSESNVQNHDDNQSTSDDNDSTEAAHAAAIGHSPQPIKPSLTADGNVVTDALTEKAEDVTVEVIAGSKNSANDDNQATMEEGENSSNTKMDDEDLSKLPIQPVLESDTDKCHLSSIDNATGKLNSSTHNDESKKKIQRLPNDAPILKSVQKLELDRTLNLNERDDDENTPLHIAIIALKLDHVKVLLEAGASHRIRCDGSLPVHTAISVGAIPANRQFAYECFVALHERGADLTVKDDAVHTPLYLACMYNLPQIVTYILSDEEGLSTLNVRADRAGNRPLHAAAKFDTLDNPSFGKTAASIATGQVQLSNHFQMDGDTAVIRHSITGLSGKHGPTNLTKPDKMESDRVVSSTDALLTQVLLGTSGIEVDALNVLGQTPLHIACMKRNWPVARLLLQAGANPKIEDRRGHTPGHLCYKRAMPIPNDLCDLLGDPPETGVIPPTREFIVDPDASTLLIHHELCMQHHTCPPILRGSEEPPPENIRRLHVLVNPLTGILRSGEFGSLVWNNEARRASMTDILKVGLQLLVVRINLLFAYLQICFAQYRCMIIHTLNASVWLRNLYRTFQMQLHIWMEIQLFHDGASNRHYVLPERCVKQ